MELSETRKQLEELRERVEPEEESELSIREGKMGEQVQRKIDNLK